MHIYLCIDVHCSWKLKIIIIFYFTFTLLFYFLFFLTLILLSSCLSPHCLSISSFFLHRPTDPSFFLRDPSSICMSPTATDPSPSTHVRPPTWPISASFLYFRHFDFVFQAVLVFRLCVSSLLVFRICVLSWVFVSGMGFGVWFRHLGSWIWVWWVSAFGCGWFCGCGFVLWWLWVWWCCVGALVVVVLHFFFPALNWWPVVVMVVVVAVANDKSGCGRCCGFFF